MAEFLKTNDISARIEDIIRGTEAGDKLVLVSPYVQISPRLFENLKDANKRRVKITLIYGKDGKLKSEEKERLHDLQNLSLRYHPHLHAKCYYNETQLIITSMNLYDFSEKTNYEMGVLVHKEEDKAIYDLAVDEVEIIRRHSDEIKKPSSLAAMGKAVMGAMNDLVDDATGMPKEGYCIRCKKPIDYDPDRPLCLSHFLIWNEFKDSDYPENWCHRCGNRRKVSMGKPLCRTCWKQDND